MNHHTIVVLNNLRSVHNVGSIFRTAEAAGVSQIFLVGTTPTPIDRFGRKRRDLAKVALGAEDMVAWEYRETLTEVVRELREQGVTIVAVEQSPTSVSYRAYTPDDACALVFGNEPEGLAPEDIALCDAVIEIPMFGKKESLNVSVTAGIILYRFAESQE
ncbi:MAG: 23S rRNA (guanosine2251-2'-O)-methyltransferase [Planctomycetota bacterium]|jgi:23S rRNA (guanosine2251-2'-O)-methyltransferase